MSLLVHETIGKYVNPTRYRQIVETESNERLNNKERETISKDQKHSSYVTKSLYQKKLSREVAIEGRACMQKIVGKDRDTHTTALASSLSEELMSSQYMVKNFIQFSGIKILRFQFIIFNLQYFLCNTNLPFMATWDRIVNLIFEVNL